MKFLDLDSKGNDLKNTVNEINILKESIECPYIVEYFGIVVAFYLLTNRMLHER